MHGISGEIVAVLDNLIPDDGSGYDTTHKRRYARTLEVLLEQSPSGSLLELGTSSIIPIALKMLKVDIDVTVTEFDLSLPASGSMVCSVGDESIEVRRYSVDLESTPLPAEDGVFDFVLCCEVLEHMDVDPMSMLGEVNRVTRDGGKLILTTPNITSSRGLWKMLRGIEPYFFMQYHKNRSPYRHNYEHSVNTVKALMVSSGYYGQVWTENTFEDEVTEDIAFLESAGFKLNRDLLGDNIFTVGTKISKVVDRYPNLLYV